MNILIKIFRLLILDYINNINSVFIRLLHVNMYF